MFWSLIFNLNVWLIKITHAVLIISIIGLFSGTLFSKVPFVKIYGKIIQWLALILLIASIFFEGYFYASKSWLEKAKEYQEKVAIAEQQSKDANKALEDKTKQLNQQIKDNQKSIQNKIKQSVEIIDKECKIPKEALDILNEAAKKPGGNK